MRKPRPNDDTAVRRLNTLLGGLPCSAEPVRVIKLGDVISSSPPGTRCPECVTTACLPNEPARYGEGGRVERKCLLPRISAESQSVSVVCAWAEGGRCSRGRDSRHQGRNTLIGTQTHTHTHTHAQTQTNTNNTPPHSHTREHGHLICYSDLHTTFGQPFMQCFRRAAIRAKATCLRHC